jgi:hypothetical protein
VNDGTKDIKIDSQPEMQGILREHYVKHFSQAQFTPFVVGELGKVMNKDGKSRTTKMHYKD